MPVNLAKTDSSEGFPIGFEHFVVIEEPHSGGNKKRHLREMIFLSVSALVCDVHPELAKQLIALDEKTIRGSGKTNLEQQHGLSV